MSEVIDLLRELVALPSVSGDEAACRDLLIRWFQARGVDVRAHGRNVIAVVEGTAGADSAAARGAAAAGNAAGNRDAMASASSSARRSLATHAAHAAAADAADAAGAAGAAGAREAAPERGLLLCSHTDVVPVGPGWTRDPWDAALHAGRIWGRGSNDAKSSVAAMAVVAAGVDPARLHGRLVLALVCDEETGGEGIESCGKDLPACTAAVVGEPTGLDACPGQRGLLRTSVIVQGRSAHASRPAEGINAIELAAHDVLAIQGLRFPDEHPLLGRATLQATVINGGTRPNVIPGECTILTDGRPTPAYDNGRMLAMLRQAVRGEVVVKSQRFHPVVTAPDSEIVAIARAASPTKTVRGFGGVSDLFHLRHLPGVVMGPGTSAASHAPDEWVAIEQVEMAVEAYAAIVAGYLGAGQASGARLPHAHPAAG
ncbi:MAG TPA: M20/M25/M40 family metallo-hydrolase [Planctomycetota bacterium]|nr:M20/M25/M40 family metallo-hydrolase [Planctomycetota bacterium]